MDVIFLPQGKRISLDAECTILDAALRANVDLASICGGKALCGKCQVIVREGSENLSLMSKEEKKHLTEEKLHMGFRLACKAKVSGDIVVRIPESSRIGKQKLVIMGIEPPLTPDAYIRKTYLELGEPTLDDPIADDVKLLREIEHIGEGLKIDYDAAKKLPDIVRTGDWKITALIIGKRIVDIEVGDNPALYGFALDIGTTKVAGFLVDLLTGELLHANGIINPQMSFGEDVISRISRAMEKDGITKLQRAVVEAINSLIEEACDKTGIHRERIYEVTAVGNTAMHHLFLGINPQYIAVSPYIPAIAHSLNVDASKMNLSIHPKGNIHVLPNIAGFVGGDAVADILATRIYEEDDLHLLIDVGTNTEVALGNRDNIFICSTASGPAFEGAHIKHGMRASTGAISSIKIEKDVCFETIDDAEPRGICGSGIVDAIAEMLRVGIIDTEGKMLRDHPRVTEHGFVIVSRNETANGNDDIVITQRDIREVQKAKAAIQTGWRILMKKLGVAEKDIRKLVIAGAFGTYINPVSARTIGMLPEVPLSAVTFVGNTAGSGARMALKSQQERLKADEIARKVHYMELAAEEDFQMEYINALNMPHANLDYYPQVAHSIKAPKTSKVYKKGTL
jgi:uncharacterized 2Fe-2S/4Fe-4S cluster protein (DUF4445 family)